MTSEVRDRIIVVESNGFATTHLGDVTLFFAQNRLGSRLWVSVGFNDDGRRRVDYDVMSVLVRARLKRRPCARKGGFGRHWCGLELNLEGHGPVCVAGHVCGATTAVRSSVLQQRPLRKRMRKA